MSPWLRACLQFVALILLVVVLFLLFPSAFGFAEMAARELRYLWWLILLLALGAWLIWAGRRRP
jgi:ABC-type nickel/cobalt efflux system permease component RcnA